MMIKRFNLRFNLEKEYDLRLWEFLQGLDTQEYKSINQFILLCIDTYIQSLAKEHKRKTLLEDITQVIQKEFQRLVLVAPYQVPIHPIQPIQNQTEQQNTSEDDDTALDFVFNNE